LKITPSKVFELVFNGTNAIKPEGEAFTFHFHLPKISKLNNTKNLKKGELKEILFD
jgi:hypothetical protein